MYNTEDAIFTSLLYTVSPLCFATERTWYCSQNDPAIFILSMYSVLQWSINSTVVVDCCLKMIHTFSVLSLQLKKLQ